MNNMPTVISFYTVDTPYEQEVQYLINSCKEFGIDYEVEGVPSARSWEMNCAFKPIFILKKLQELQKPVLWVDADAVFVKKPEPLFDFSKDLGVRLYDCPDDHPSRLVSATLFVNATKKAAYALKSWAEECMHMLEKPREKEVWDQDALRKVIFEKKVDVSFSILPPSYSKIAGHPEDERVCKDPVIVQNQASRRYKKWISHPEERIYGL